MELKPDLEATGYSDQNAFYFAKMSRVAYSTKDEVQSFFKDNETTTGLVFDHFHWFEVSLRQMYCLPLE